jgi:hypothetical protein
MKDMLKNMVKDTATALAASSANKAVHLAVDKVADALPVPKVITVTLASGITKAAAAFGVGKLVEQTSKEKSLGQDVGKSMQYQAVTGTLTSVVQGFFKALK